MKRSLKILIVCASVLAASFSSSVAPFSTLQGVLAASKPAGASLVVRPVVNGSGSKIKVSVKGFPGKAPLLVSAYPLSNPHAVVSKQGITRQSGKADVTLKIPSYLDSYLGEAWVAQVSTTAGASLSLTSNSFYVETGSSPLNLTATFAYTVRPGDYLSLIARQFGTTVADIIALNPEITSSKYVYPGEVLIIPARNLPEGYTPLVYTPEGYVYPNTPIVISAIPRAMIIPASGPQSTYIQVMLSGFPANTSVTIGLHKLNRKLIESTAHATTDAYGTSVVTMRIPAGNNINNNRVWLAKVTTDEGTDITVESNPFYVTGN